MMIPFDLRCPCCDVGLVHQDEEKRNMTTHKISWDTYICPECEGIYTNKPDLDIIDEEV